MSTKHNSTTCQPVFEGPNVCFENGLFVAYANGNRVEAFSNSQLAWQAARSAVFAPQPSIVIRPYFCEDRLSPDYGECLWTEFEYGTDSEGYATQITFPVEPTDDAYNVPSVYAFGKEGIPLDEVDRVLPQIIALMNSPEVQAARKRWEAQRQAHERR